MRHLTRLYFENTTAVENFVSIVDQGVDQGNPVFNSQQGTISDPMNLPEVQSALQFLQYTACFFKLPIGAHAIVDVYIPDVIGSADPKVFDYQVFKAKNKASSNAKARARGMTEFHERLKKIPAEIFKVASSHAYKTEGSQGQVGPTGPIAGTGPTGPSGTCYYSSSGPSGPSSPCGGTGSIPCEDTMFTRASCVKVGEHHELKCVHLEPPGKE
jgi:hypothetical protein